MRRSVYDKIRRQIEKLLPGAVFVTREFLELGSGAAVDEALSRLTREGVSRRLGRGLYDYPRLHPVFGPVPAEPVEIAAALARKTGSRLQGAGGQAANALGLSTEVPVRAVYLTDGRRRTVQVGGQTNERSLLGKKSALQREALNAPGWLVPILQEIARSGAKSNALAKSKLAKSTTADERKSR